MLVVVVVFARFYLCVDGATVYECLAMDDDDDSPTYGHRVVLWMNDERSRETGSLEQWLSALCETENARNFLCADELIWCIHAGASSASS